PQSSLRGAAPAGDRPGHRHRPEGPPPRRAGGGNESAGETRPDRSDRPRPAALRAHRALDRARHGSGDADLRADHRARPRSDHRLRHPEGNAERPEGDRGLPGRTGDGGGDMSALLEIEDLDVHYGAIHALKGVTLKVEERQIVTLIGANGAGKSTTLRAI